MLGSKIRKEGEGEPIPTAQDVAKNILGAKIIGEAAATAAENFVLLGAGVGSSSPQADTQVVENPPPPPPVPALSVAKLKGVLASSPELLPTFVEAELRRPPAEQRRTAFELFRDVATKHGATELAATLEDIVNAGKPGPEPVDDGDGDEQTLEVDGGAPPPIE